MPRVQCRQTSATTDPTLPHKHLGARSWIHCVNMQTAYAPAPCSGFERTHRLTLVLNSLSRSVSGQPNWVLYVPELPQEANAPVLTLRIKPSRRCC